MSQDITMQLVHMSHVLSESEVILITFFELSLIIMCIIIIINHNKIITFANHVQG